MKVNLPSTILTLPNIQRIGTPNKTECETCQLTKDPGAQL